MFTVDNMLHSHVKRSPLLWFHMKISPFEMINYFINVYSINRKLHARLEIRNFSSRVEKYFTSEGSEFYVHFIRKMFVYLSK